MREKYSDTSLYRIAMNRNERRTLNSLSTTVSIFKFKSTKLILAFSVTRDQSRHHSDWALRSAKPIRRVTFLAAESRSIERGPAFSFPSPHLPGFVTKNRGKNNLCSRTKSWRREFPLVRRSGEKKQDKEACFCGASRFRVASLYFGFFPPPPTPSPLRTLDKNEKDIGRED